MFATLALDTPLSKAVKPPGQLASEGRGKCLYILLASVAACYDLRRLLRDGF